MTLDILDTVRSAFGRIASKATLGVVGVTLALLLLVGGLGILAGALTSISAVLGALVGLAAVAVYIAGAASLTVGSMRAFDEKDFNKEMFTDNILWPFLRMTGANITTQAFVFMAAYFILYPLLLVGIGGSVATSAGATAALSGATTALAAVGGVIVAFIALYVLSALLLALPRIAVNDRRMFQALDESIQATSGKRLRVIATLLPFAVLIVTAFAGAFREGIAGYTIYGVSIFLSSFYMLAILTELNSRLE